MISKNRKVVQSSYRILSTTLTKSIEIFITVVVRLATVPLFLSSWGPELFGQWLVLSTLLTYFTMGNLGFAQAAANEMTILVAKGKKKNALSTYQTTFLLLLTLSVVLLLLSCILATWLPLSRWMNLTLIEGRDLQFTVLLFSGCVVVWFALTLFLAGYRCEGKYHRGIMYVNAFILFDFFGMAAGLWFKGTVVCVAFSMLIFRMLLVFCMYFDLKYIAPWITLGYANASFNEMKRLISPSVSFALFPLSQVIVNQGIVMAIGATIGPVMVVVFTTSRILVNLTVKVFDVVNHAMYPELSMSWATGNLDRIRKLHRFSCQASFWLGIIAIGCIYFIGEWIFNIWTGAKVPFDVVLMNILLGTMFLRAVWYASFVLPSAINKHQKNTLIYLGASIAGLFLAVVLLKTSTLYHSVLGLALIDIVMIVTVLPTSLKLSKDSLWKLLSTMARPNPRPLITILKARIEQGRF